jgi:hypothetical protein
MYCDDVVLKYRLFLAGPNLDDNDGSGGGDDDDSDHEDDDDNKHFGIWTCFDSCLQVTLIICFRRRSFSH